MRMDRLFYCLFVATIVSQSPSVSAAPKSEADVIAMIKKLEGSVIRNQEVPNKPVIYVSLTGTKVQDEHLKYLSLIPSIETLDLNYTAVTDKGVKYVKSLRKLKVLQLIEVKAVTDKGLSLLVGLKDLENLNITGAKRITDRGVKAFKKAMPKVHVFR